MKIFLLFGLLIIHDAICLRNVQLIFPKSVDEGGNATLFCQYDLEGEHLYSVKWYRGSHEFYRYHPKDIPRMLTFHLPGLNVDINASNSNRVTLTNVPRHLGGNFTCEISVEEPTYTTRYVTHYLEVVPKNEDEKESNKSLYADPDDIKPDNLIICEPENKTNVAESLGIMRLFVIAVICLYHRRV